MFNCPICSKGSEESFFQITFREKTHIPTSIELCYCKNCDFSFTVPRNQAAYNSYYKANSNDRTHRLDVYSNIKQLNRIKRFVENSNVKSILDYGCGGGGLVSELSKIFLDVECTGFDINADFPSHLPNLNFVTSLPSEQFDLVIASHVIEHIADMDIIRRIFHSVKIGGYIYIEVPDPLRYVDFDKPQFMYYIDRIHINHFSQKAILELTPKGFDVTEAGIYEIPYNLGDVYPCSYIILKRNRAHENIRDAMVSYIQNEINNSKNRSKFLKNRKFYIYGYGDNYFRNLMDGGILFNLEDNIIGFIDKDADNLNENKREDRNFIHPDRMDKINGSLIVCTVTQFESLSQFFSEKYPLSEVIYI